MDRRHFVKTTIGGLTFMSALSGSLIQAKKNKNQIPVALIKSNNRENAVKQLIEMVKLPSPRGKKIFIKPNFNTADPSPGSTHNDTLKQMVIEFQKRGSKSITVGDRSGPQKTEEVLKNKGIHKMAKELEFEVVDFTKLPEEEWIHFNPKGNHWQNGFSLAKPAVNSEYLVFTHCLKTHQYGGIFTLALKLTVGMAPKKLMSELHRSPNMRQMITELNQPFQPRFLLMDGLEAFVDGGPMTGTKKRAEVFLAGTDRTAIDAVGIAILKELGSNEAIMNTKIFKQEQIQRAVQLSLGITHPEQIELITNDTTSRNYAKKIRDILLKG